MYCITRLIVPLLHKERPKPCNSRLSQLVTPSEGTLIAHCDDKLHVYNLLTNCEVAEHKLPDNVQSTSIIVIDRNTLLLIGMNCSFDVLQPREVPRAVALVLSSHDGFRTMQIHEKTLMTFANAIDWMAVSNALVIDQDLLISVVDLRFDKTMHLYTVPVADILKSARDGVMGNNEDMALSSRGSYPAGSEIFRVNGSRFASVRTIPDPPIIIDLIDLESETSKEMEISIIEELNSLEDCPMISCYRMPDKWSTGVPTVMGCFFYGPTKVQFNFENGTATIDNTPYALKHLHAFLHNDLEEDEYEDVVLENHAIPAFTDTECYAALKTDNEEWESDGEDEEHVIVRMYKDRVPSLTRLSLKAVLRLLSERKRRDMTVAHDPSNVNELVSAILE